MVKLILSLAEANLNDFFFPQCNLEGRLGIALPAANIDTVLSTSLFHFTF